ncbi:phytoene desaturase family protein [Streptomyces albidus (ex Kaewkla and Franco 2022)]|uniref:phytoene desaturase family protein n=1 Tax=Streptomyces albidus (ex Kaewkla and Franco 2022) TaxID=722709 RepID=UPI0015EECE53|nr:NAD(P)/FAD-dependent oxidoreductase [Streptomyces albidus (ex Kaewkla and Franco 2022)]
MARIAVIGAGLGAMAASARLAVAGHEVTVHERTETFGGGVRLHERDGFRFDTGPGLLHLPAVYRDLFVKTGREPLEKCVELVRLDPAVRHVFADGTAVSLPHASRAGVIEALDGALGKGAGERWTDLLARARTVWDATRRPLLEEPLSAADVPAARALSARDPYPALRRKGLLRRRTPTLAEVAADELRDPRLAAMLTGCAHAYGLDPRRAPAGAAVLAYLEHTFGSWHVRGGMRRLAEALYERCLERGVDFRFGTEVLRVREENGRASGLELADGPDVDADAVVAGSCRPSADAATPDADVSGVPAASRLTVLLALRGARPTGTAHRTVVHRADAPGTPLTVLRPDDPTLRPDAEHESAVLSVTVRADEVPDREEASLLADRLITAADTAGLNLGERMLWRVVHTPEDIERETGVPGGLVPAPALAGEGIVRPPNRTATKGLYRAGGWGHPGGGPAHAGMSGALVAGLIVEGDDWRGSR